MSRIDDEYKHLILHADKVGTFWWESLWFYDGMTVGEFFDEAEYYGKFMQEHDNNEEEYRPMWYLRGERHPQIGIYRFIEDKNDMG